MAFIYSLINIEALSWSPVVFFTISLPCDKFQKNNKRILLSSGRLRINVVHN